MRAVACTHLEDGTPLAITGAGGNFGGAGEVIVWNLRTDECSKRLPRPTRGRTLLRSGRGLPIGTATEIVALQHERPGIHLGPHRRRAIRGSDNGPLSRVPVAALLAALPDAIIMYSHRYGCTWAGAA